MTSLRLVGALEIGGTHVTAAVLVVGQRTIAPASLRRHELATGASGEDLVRSIVIAAQQLAVLAVTRWGVATPGPFDYARGISRIRGCAKC